MLNQNHIYFSILGIRPTTDINVIKKAYRKKALHWHPDKNKTAEAEEKFIEINEAYEALIFNKTNQNYTKNIVKSKDDLMAERMKNARARYYESKQKTERTERLFYESLISGKKGKIFKSLAILGAVFGVLWLIDIWVIRNITNTISIDEVVVAKSMYFKLEINGFLYFFNQVEVQGILKNNQIITQTSVIFQDLVSIKVQDYFEGFKTVEPYFSFITFTPVLQFLFIVPLGVYYFRKPTIWFTFLYLFSKYIVFGLVVLIILFKAIAILFI